MDRLAKFDHGCVGVVAGCSLVEVPVWAVLVVVLDEVVEEPVELVLVPDQGAIQELMADGTNPTFSESVGLWRTWRRSDRFGADGGEHMVERSGVLAGAVTDHEPDRFAVAQEEVAGGLGGPGPGGVGGDAGEVDASGVDLDEEQHVKAAEGDGVDTEEVCCDHGVGLAVDELAPCGSGPIRCRLAAILAEDFPDSGGGDAVSESVEFAVDAPVAPGRVLAIETEYESADLCWCGWSAGSRCRWLGPVAGDETAVPSDHGGGFDDQHHGCESGPVEGGREHGQDGPIGGCESGTVDLSLQHEDLMSKSKDFGVTLVAGHEEQAEASNR